MKKLTDEIIEKISAICGAENFSAAAEELVCYSYDATNTEFLPDLVVFPGSAREVSAIMKLANAERIPVVPRGAGSGFTGGSLAIKGGIVLSTERLNRILDIDIENMTALVEPGVVNGILADKVEEVGLFYPPDPASLKFSTIGGNIAECAGGPRAVKYGVTRDYVLSLEAVLPTGEIINTGVKTLKGVVGYDLTRLIIGSEGTLVIVTKALLRLIAKPETTVTMLAEFAELRKAARAVRSIMNSGIVPSTIEIIDSASIRCVNEGTEATLPEAGALLLIEVDGSQMRARAEAAEIESTCLKESATGVSIAKDRREAKALWQARRSISPTLAKLRPTKLNEDVVVPRSRIVELIEGVEEISKELNVIIASFGHAGDGNIHVNVMVDDSNPVEAAAGERAVTEVFKLALKLEGTISGEHGVGTTKAPYLGMELAPEVIVLMKAIKTIFDPHGILNPGKIFYGGRHEISDLMNKKVAKV